MSVTSSGLMEVAMTARLLDLAGVDLPSKALYSEDKINLIKTIHSSARQTPQA